MSRSSLQRFCIVCLLVVAVTLPTSVKAEPTDVLPPAGETGLLPVSTDAKEGKILLTLPKPDTDGVAIRLLYSTALRTGLGSAPLTLDRGRTGNTQMIAFRQIGGKVAVQFENPRFRASKGDTPQQQAVESDFGTSLVWLTDIAEFLNDGRLVIDIAPFLERDALGIARSLNQSQASFGLSAQSAIAGKGFKLNEKLSLADPSSVRVFPDNLEMDAVQTFASQTPGAEVSNIVPDPNTVTFRVHHSFIRLPEPGFVPLRFDRVWGAFQRRWSTIPPVSQSQWSTI